jgi:hypothetical protein
LERKFVHVAGAFFCHALILTRLDEHRENEEFETRPLPTLLGD